MTHYPIPPKDISDPKPDPELQKRKAERKKLLERIEKQRVEIIRKKYKR